MGKEIKVGLGIIMVLMIVLGVVLVRRLSKPGELPTAELKGDRSNATGDFSSGEDEPPTLLEASKDSDWIPPRQPATEKQSERWQSTSDATQADEATSRRFMPSDPSSDRYGAGFGKSSSSKNEDHSHKNYRLQETEPFRTDINSDEDNQYENYGERPLPLNPAGVSDSEYDGSAAIPRDQLGEPTTLRISASHHDDDGHSNRDHSRDPYQLPMNTAYQQQDSSASRSQNYNNFNTSRQSSQSPARPYRINNATSSNSRGYSSLQPFNSTQRRERPVTRRENTGTYHVEPGDNFWRISQKMYGVGGYFKALSAENHLAIPTSSDLRVGDEISTPAVEELHKKFPGLCPKRRTSKPGTPHVSEVSASRLRPGRGYVVEEGDTLYGIARYELGDGSRWPEIFQLNRRTVGKDMDYLKPGTRLVLPADPNTTKKPAQRQDRLTRERENQLRR